MVLDIKQENFDLTSGWRASQGQSVFLFNPFAEDRRTHRWNPLSYVSRGSRVPGLRPAEHRRDAVSGRLGRPEVLGQPGAQCVHGVRAVSLRATSTNARRGDGPRLDRLFPTLGGIYRLSSGDGSDLRQYLQGLSDDPSSATTPEPPSPTCSRRPTKPSPRSWARSRNRCNAFINPVLDAATSGNDFLLTDVRKKKMTIYIGIQPNKLAESRADREPVLQPADQPQHPRTAAEQPRAQAPVPAADGRIHLDRQGRHHRLGGLLHGRLQPAPAADHPEHGAARRHLRQGRLAHHHHQPRAADHLRAARAAGRQRLLRDARLHHRAQAERHARARACRAANPKSAVR